MYPGWMQASVVILEEDDARSTLDPLEHNVSLYRPPTTSQVQRIKSNMGLANANAAIVLFCYNRYACNANADSQQSISSWPCRRPVHAVLQLYFVSMVCDVRHIAKGRQHGIVMPPVHAMLASHLSGWTVMRSFLLQRGLSREDIALTSITEGPGALHSIHITGWGSSRRCAAHTEHWQRISGGGLCQRLSALAAPKETSLGTPTGMSLPLT